MSLAPGVTRTHPRAPGVTLYSPQVTLTANQNIILREVEPAWKADIQRTLEVSIFKD